MAVSIISKLNNKAVFLFISLHKFEQFPETIVLNRMSNCRSTDLTMDNVFYSIAPPLNQLGPV